MRIVIIGSGGVGGYFGALLARRRQGHEISFVARGAHLEAMQKYGLLIHTPQGEWTTGPLQATDQIETLGVADLVLLCVKNYDLPAVLERMHTIVGPDTAVITLQNGVQAPELAREKLGPQHVLPGVVYCEVSISAPGVIRRGTDMQRFIFGEYDRSLTERAMAIAQVFTAAGAETILSENIHSAIWTKCTFICAMSGVTTLARQPLGALLADAETRQLLQAIMQEAYSVGQAHGVEFDTDPVAAGMATAARFPYEAKSSMLRDYERGAQIEIEALNGAIVHYGRQYQVATPANQALYAVLSLYNTSRGQGSEIRDQENAH